MKKYIIRILLSTCIFSLSAVYSSGSDYQWKDITDIDNNTAILKIAWNEECSFYGDYWFSEKAGLITDSRHWTAGTTAEYGRFAYHRFNRTQYTCNFTDAYRGDGDGYGITVAHGTAVRDEERKTLPYIYLNDSDCRLLDISQWRGWKILYFPYSREYIQREFKRGEILVYVEETPTDNEFEEYVGDDYMAYDEDDETTIDADFLSMWEGTWITDEGNESLVIQGSTIILKNIIYNNPVFKTTYRVYNGELWAGLADDSYIYQLHPENHTISGEGVDKFVLKSSNNDNRITDENNEDGTSNGSNDSALPQEETKGTNNMKWVLWGLVGIVSLIALLLLIASMVKKSSESNHGKVEDGNVLGKKNSKHGKKAAIFVSALAVIAIIVIGIISLSPVRRIEKEVAQSFRQNVGGSDAMDITCHLSPENNDSYLGAIELELYGETTSLPVRVTELGDGSKMWEYTITLEEAQYRMSGLLVRASGVSNWGELSNYVLGAAKTEYERYNSEMTRYLENNIFRTHTTAYMEHNNRYVNDYIKPFVDRLGGNPNIYNSLLITEEQRTKEEQEFHDWSRQAVKKARNKWVDDNPQEARRRGITKF